MTYAWVGTPPCLWCSSPFWPTPHLGLIHAWTALSASCHVDPGGSQGERGSFTLVAVERAYSLWVPSSSLT